MLRFAVVFSCAVVSCQKYVTLPFVRAFRDANYGSWYEISLMMLVFERANPTAAPANVTNEGYCGFLASTRWNRVHQYSREFYGVKDLVNPKGELSFDFVGMRGDDVKAIATCGHSFSVNIEGTVIGFEHTGIGFGLFHDRAIHAGEVVMSVIGREMVWIVDVEKEKPYKPATFPPFKCKRIDGNNTDTFQLSEGPLVQELKPLRLTHTMGGESDKKETSISTKDKNVQPFVVVLVADLPLAFLWHDTASTINLNWPTTWQLKTDKLISDKMFTQKNSNTTGIVHMSIEVQLQCVDRILRTV